MQSAKPIDVTRSFVPVNPNAYPENLHGTGREDAPEDHIPVVPYIGVNFLPTAYGVKSYFGTQFAIDVDSLSPNKLGHLFIFQTLTYKNVLVALCDTGVWTKDSSTDGAWTQADAITPIAEDIYFEWTFAILKNELYVFYSNADHYYKITTSGDGLGITITKVMQADVTFITLNSQLGLFRLGSRIAFWDANNAISWSSPDDLKDFKPAVLTGANVTTFNSIQGRISAIRPHGQHAMCYASKSVVMLQVQPAETFLVKAVPILDNVGVPYMRQSVEGNPNTIHYLYSDAGIYKIDKGIPEIIIPQVYDYFKEFTPTPIYLKMLEGRYLAFECTDINAIDGKAQFSRSVIPPSTLTFLVAPGTVDEVNTLDPATAPLCDIITKLDAGGFSDQQSSLPSMPGRKGGTPVKPVWTCYISDRGVKDLSNLAWTSNPCGTTDLNGQPATLSPNGGITTDKMTTDSTNKRAVTGDQAYTTGGWTMERFVQVQTAIWDAEAKVAKKLVEKIKARKFAGSKTTARTNACVVNANPAYANCFIGDYVTDFSNPQFGFNKCSFWLTRYAIGAERINAKWRTTTACVTPPPQPAVLQGYRIGGSSGPTEGTIYGSSGAASAVILSRYPPGVGWAFAPPSAPTNAIVGAALAYQVVGFVVQNGGTSYSYAVYACWVPIGANSHLADGTGTTQAPALNANITENYDIGYVDKQEAFVANNLGEGPRVGVLGVETAYCEITGWEYTDTTGATRTTGAITCDTTADKTPGSHTATRQVPMNDPRRNPLDPSTGDFCGLHYEKPLDPNVDWSDQSVVYPGGDFLLQVGSIAPRYPTFEGALIYDTAIKKWGKLKCQYKQLLDYSPLNSASASTISFSNFGIVAGLVKVDGKIYLFDNNPTESYITWGKIGYYRLGMTDAQEVRVDFKVPSTGTLTVDTSLDGSAVGAELSTSQDFSSALQAICYPSYSGKWHNITVSGKFDIAYLEFKGLQKGRR